LLYCAAIHAVHRPVECRRTGGSPPTVFSAVAMLNPHPFLEGMSSCVESRITDPADR
jgi:hypothetical protein